MHIFSPWNSGFCNITEKPLFIPLPAKALVIQPSHMHTTSSGCWSLAKIILCFSIPQHSGELCQRGAMPTCAPPFSHSLQSLVKLFQEPHSWPTAHLSIPQWPVLAHHLQHDSPCRCGFPYSVPCTPHHTKKWMLLTTSSLVLWLNGAVLGIECFCSMGLRWDPYEAKVPLDLSSKWGLWALFQMLDSSCHCSAPQPLPASAPKVLHCTSSHQPKNLCNFLVSASIAPRPGQVSGQGNRQLSCIC